MKAVLIGDSIRMGYQPLVAAKCAGIDVWGPAENCRHSLWALEHFKPWVADQKPDVVHFNFGIHDAMTGPDGEHQIQLSQYTLCLRRFIRRIRESGCVKMIWAMTTPRYAPEQGKPMSAWRVLSRERIDEYNAAALEIVKGEGLPVNDLHGIIMSSGFSRCLADDGCHMTEFGNAVLSDAVAEALARTVLAA